MVLQHRLAATALALLGVGGCTTATASPPAPDPIAVVEAWVIGGIWVDPTSALYTTPEGARAILELLDEFPLP